MADSLNRQRAEPHCSRGRPASVCCIGEPWDSPNIAEQVREWGEPLRPPVIETAAMAGLDPHVLDAHVEGVHGFEPHDDGYAEAVAEAAECLARAVCPVEDYAGYMSWYFETRLAAGELIVLEPSAGRIGPEVPNV